MKGKDILCVVDFSESSVDALKWAFDLAARIKATVNILFCYRLVAAMHDEETLSRKRRIENEAKLKFKAFQDKHLARQPVSHRFISEAGFPHFRIEMFLDKNPVGLLVLGSSVVQHFDEYKVRGFEAFLLKATIPVVVVPHDK